MHLGREMEPQHGAIRVVALNRMRTIVRAYFDAYLPELLIARTHIAQSGPKNSAGNITFPVVLGLRTKDDANLDCGLEVIDLPLNPKVASRSPGAGSH